MRNLVLHLQSATAQEQIHNVSSFVGEDASGSFGILPGHARMMTLLTFGLTRFRVAERDWEYVALPGGLLYLVDNQLHLCTRRYFRSAQYQDMEKALTEHFLSEEQELHAVRESLQRLEQEMLKRLLEVNRASSG